MNKNDCVECISSEGWGSITEGREYKIQWVDGHGWVSIVNDTGDVQSYPGSNFRIIK